MQQTKYSVSVSVCVCVSVLLTQANPERCMPRFPSGDKNFIGQDGSALEILGKPANALVFARSLVAQRCSIRRFEAAWPRV